MNGKAAPTIETLVRTRLPTAHGEFQLHYFSNPVDDKEHVALVKGSVDGKKNVPVRVHSECLTGDVFGSRRCDCGKQLDLSLLMIEQAGFGILIYLRQEGRGIGLLKKLQAYNLQDQGFDTVEANIQLGHLPDERDYTQAALILRELGVSSIELITNNPDKISGLEAMGIKVEKRLSIESVYHHENVGYLKAKAEKLRHLLTFNQLQKAGPVPEELQFMQPFIDRLAEFRRRNDHAPFFTLSYAQSIDGSISLNAESSLPLSGGASLKLTHLLRAHHDALLIGINTTLVDNPRLNVRHVEGDDPQPVILDCLLRFPEDAKMLGASTKLPIIVATEQASADKQRRLEAKGIRVYRVEQSSDGHIDLAALRKLLTQLGIKTVMVEGGAEVINAFLLDDLIDYCVITIAPKIIGGLRAVEKPCRPVLEIKNCRYQPLGSDLILYGALHDDD